MTQDICHIYVPRNQTAGNAPCGILPGSGIVGKSTSDGQQIEIWYEGNAHSAINLNTFAEKISCAAGRMTSHYPTSARAVVDTCDMVLVGEFHPAEGRVDIHFVDLVSKWCGEETASELLTAHGLQLKMLKKMAAPPMTPGARWAALELARLGEASF
jgi:hypothetical protein